MRFAGAAGKYNLRVQYFDLNIGARLQVSNGSKVIDAWTAPGYFPAKKIDASASARHTTESVALRPGDEIRIESKAAVDYIELLPE
jgi:hypothetical protein